MPTTYSFFHEDGYVIVTCTGRLTDDDLLNSWKELYEGDEWIPGLNELVDCSQIDASAVIESRWILDRERCDFRSSALIATLPVAG
jgi:hypothetical protein